jgi:ACS family hexuronate transporter-like MFS transporter
LIAPAVIPLMALNYGWRSTFVVAGLLGIVWIFSWIRSSRKPRSRRRRDHLGPQGAVA